MTDSGYMKWGGCSVNAHGEPPKHNRSQKDSLEAKLKCKDKIRVNSNKNLNSKIKIAEIKKNILLRKPPDQTKVVQRGKAETLLHSHSS